MMRKSNLKPADFWEVQRLADDALRAFEQGYFRALMRLELKKRCAELKPRYSAKRAGKFIVIEGGAQKKRVSGPLGTLPGSATGGISRTGGNS